MIILVEGTINAIASNTFYMKLCVLSVPMPFIFGRTKCAWDNITRVCNYRYRHMSTVNSPVTYLQ